MAEGSGQGAISLRNRLLALQAFQSLATARLHQIEQEVPSNVSTQEYLRQLNEKGIALHVDEPMDASKLWQESRRVEQDDGVALCARY